MTQLTSLNLHVYPLKPQEIPSHNSGLSLVNNQQKPSLDQFVSATTSEDKIDFFTNIKVQTTKTLIQKALTQSKDKKASNENRESEVKEVENAILTQLETLKQLTDSEKYGIRTLANFVHQAKVQDMPPEKMEELINELAYMSYGFKANDKTAVKDAYEQSELFLDIAFRYSKEGKDPKKLFASAFQNGLEAEGLSSDQAHQTAGFLSKIIHKLDDKARAEVFKAAGIMMNYQEPLQFLIRNFKNDTSVENDAFKQFKDVMKFSDDTQKQVTQALLSVINEQEFDSKLDQKTLAAIADVQDPLSLVDNDTKSKQKEEILAKAKNSQLSQDSIKNLERILENPELLIDGLSLGFQETKKVPESRQDQSECSWNQSRPKPLCNLLRRLFSR
jgi:hypothetical protein